MEKIRQLQMQKEMRKLKGKNKLYRKANSGCHL